MEVMDWKMMGSRVRKKAILPRKDGPKGELNILKKVSLRCGAEVSIDEYVGDTNAGKSVWIVGLY